MENVFTGSYVYCVKVDGKNKYIGKGKGNRYKHPTSGKSSCAELNRDFYAGKDISVVLVENNVPDCQIDKLEKQWILTLIELGNELYNKRL